MKKIGLYIHIPFRIYKHNHRGMLSFFNKDFYIKSYFRYLKKELIMRHKDEYIIDSIYIGGGDPSAMDTDYITGVLDYVYENFNVEEGCEKTIEIDPLSPEIRVRRYIEHGINRFSVKVFTFNKKGLNNLDLYHEKDDVIQLVKTIRKLGVENINFDMYFSYPEQSLKDLDLDIHIVDKLKIPHVSFYSVKIGGHIGSIEDSYESKISDFDYMHKIGDLMAEKNYKKYEINHFVKGDYESFHNKKYWNLEDYLGVGLGSSGLIDGNLYKNSIDFEEYFSMLDEGKLPSVENQDLSLEEEEKYYIINKMGMKEGINFHEFEAKFGRKFREVYKELIDKYMLENLIEVSSESIKFTELGMLNASEFYMDII